MPPTGLFRAAVGRRADIALLLALSLAAGYFAHSAVSATTQSYVYDSPFTVTQVKQERPPNEVDSTVSYSSSYESRPHRRDYYSGGRHSHDSQDYYGEEEGYHSDGHHPHHSQDHYGPKEHQHQDYESGGHPHDSEVGYGKKELPCCLRPLRYHEHEYPKVGAVRGVALFDKCPAMKDDDAVCAAVAKRYAAPGTSLFSVPRSQYQLYSSDSDVSLDSSGALFKSLHNKSAGRGSSPYSCAKTSLVTKKAADIAVFGQACCYNIDFDTSAGTQLQRHCHSDVIGDPNDLDLLFQYSVYAAGGANLVNEDSDTKELEGPSIVAGNYYGSGDFEFATEYVAIRGVFAGVGFFTGLIVVPNGDTDDIDVQNGIAKVGSDSGDRLTGSYVSVGPGEAAAAAATISAQVCALSENIRSLHTSGTVYVDNTASDLSIVVECDERAGISSNICVVNLRTEDFNESISFTVTGNGATIVMINVEGDPVARYIDGAVLVIDDSTNVVWNFIDAHVVLLDGVGPFQHNIICPRAKVLRTRLSTDGSIHGAVLMGHIGSVFDFLGGDMLFTSTSRVQTTEAECHVTLCDCLCPDEKKKKRD